MRIANEYPATPAPMTKISVCITIVLLDPKWYKGKLKWDIKRKGSEKSVDGKRVDKVNFLIFNIIYDFKYSKCRLIISART